MEYTKTIAKKQCQITIDGDITFADHAAFRQTIELFADAGIDTITYDLRNVGFMDSAALGMLLLARDEASKKNKKIVLEHPAGQVKKIFQVTRFYELFTVVE